jgi:hypothetical protein
LPLGIDLIGGAVLCIEGINPLWKNPGKLSSFFQKTEEQTLIEQHLG